MDAQSVSLESSEGHDTWSARDGYTNQGRVPKRYANGRCQQSTPGLTIHLTIHCHVDPRKPPFRKRMRPRTTKKPKKKPKARDKQLENTDSEQQCLLGNPYVKDHLDDDPSIHVNRGLPDTDGEANVNDCHSARAHRMVHSKPYASVMSEVFNPVKILGIWYDFKPKADLSSTGLSESAFRTLQMELSDEVAHSMQSLIRILDLYESLSSKVQRAIEHQLSNFSRDIIILSTTPGTTRTIADDQQYYEPIPEDHHFFHGLKIMETWSEGNFATLMSTLSYHRDVLNWLSDLTPELAYTKIRSIILCTIYPEAPQDCLTFPGIMELCCSYLLEACQTDDPTMQKLAVSYIDGLSRWCCHSQDLLEKEGIGQGLKELWDAGTFDRNPWANTIVRRILNIDEPNFSGCQEDYIQDQNSTPSFTISTQTSMRPRRAPCDGIGRFRPSTIPSRCAQHLLQALTPYRLLFVLLLAAFGGWKAYASTHSETNTTNVLDWLIGIIVTIGLFLLGELEGSKFAPWAFRSFAGPVGGR